MALLPRSIVISNGLVQSVTTGLVNLASDVTGTLTLSNMLLGEPVNAQSGTSYTVLDGDRNKLVTFNNGSAVAVTLPQAGTSSQFAANWYADFTNYGVGTVTITPTTSTINNGASTYTLATGQSVRIISDGTNYQVTAIGGGSVPILSGVGSPSSGLGASGAVYFDISDPMNLQFWYKT